MKFNISEKDLSLLIALHEHPMARFSELAERLDVSPTTISNRYNEITKTSVNRVVADLDIYKLDLELVDIFVKTKNFQQTNIIINFCDEHTYTLYRSQIFGIYNGLFIQFRIPRGTGEHLKEQFLLLQNKGNIESFQIYSHKYPSVITRMLLSHWKETKQWIFNWKKWEKQLELVMNINLNSKIKKKNNAYTGNVLSKLDTLDMLILEELTKGCSRRKHSEIIKTIESNLEPNSRYGTISKQTFSHRLKYLKKNVINGYHLFFDWKTFDIHRTLIVISETEPEFVAALYFQLQQEPLPFGTKFRALSENKYMWYLTLPSNHFFNLYDILWKHAISLEIYSFQYKSTVHYGLWHKSYNEDLHQWDLNY